MSRGSNAIIGDTKISANGYHYTKTKKGWRLTHHIIAEQNLGRAIDTSQVRVVFKDKNRDNLTPSNIDVQPKKRGKVQRIEILETRIQILQEELDELKKSI